MNFIFHSEFALIVNRLLLILCSFELIILVTFLYCIPNLRVCEIDRYENAIKEKFGEVDLELWIYTPTNFPEFIF